MAYYGILLFFVLEYVQPGNYVPLLISLHLNSLVPLSTFALSLLSQGPVKITDVFASTNARWLIYLLGLLIISGLTCDVKHYALNVFQSVFGYCLAYCFLRKELYTYDRIKKVCVTLVLAHVAIGILNPELMSGDGERHYVTAGYFLGDGNDFALSVNVTIPFCLFLMLNSQRTIWKLIWAGLLFLLVAAVVMTQSRGGILALSGIGLYYWFKNKRKMFGVIGIILVVGFVFAIAPQQFFDRMATLTKTGEERDGSAQGRILAWTAAIQMALDHPFLGVGAGHFPVKYGAEYQTKEYGINALPWVTAHSSYFLLLGELGFPGLIFLIGFLVSNFLATERLLRMPKQEFANGGQYNLLVAVNASLIGFAIGGAFISAAYYPHIYLLAALLEDGRYVYQNSLQQSDAIVRETEDARTVAYHRVHSW